MHILFVSNDAYPPELRAGLGVNTHVQCEQLIARGHEVAVAARTEMPDAAPLDHACGYPVFRSTALTAAVEFALRARRPDVVVLLEPYEWANPVAALVSNIPLVLYPHSMQPGSRFLDPRIAVASFVLAPSTDCAARLRTAYGIRAIAVPSVFGIDRFASVVPKGDSVLFVGLQKRKGADLAIEMAKARPERSFTFVESWTGNTHETEGLREELSRLPNVRALPNQEDLGPILAETKLLLMPSRSQEAWGRMASEAQACGIPVLASSSGHLPETVGRGGVCLDPDAPLSKWLAAFDRIMGDQGYYGELAAAARAHSKDVIALAHAALDTLESVLEAAARTFRPDVGLVRRRVQSKPRRLITLADLRTAVRLSIALPQSWMLPQKLWPRSARWTSLFGATLAGRSNAGLARRMSTALKLPASQTEELAGELRACSHELALQCLRGFRPGSWRPQIDVVGIEGIEAARAQNRGCVLWVSHFVFAANVAKVALRDLGIAHLSRIDHGFSKSQFGIAVLNPLRTGFEGKFLSERIVFDRQRPLAAVKRANAILTRGGVLSLTAGAWEGGHLAEADFLGSRISLAMGPVVLARATSSALVPVFAIRMKKGRFLVKTGPEIDVHSQASEDQAMQEGTARYLAQLAPWVLRFPGQWRGWTALTDGGPD